MDSKDYGKKICSWEDLCYTDASSLLEASSSAQGISNKLEDILGLDMQTEDRRELKRLCITRDLFFNAVMFSRKETFNPQQLSAMFTIVKTIHQLCVSTSYDNISICCETMKELLVSHSVHRPPFSIQLFSLDQVRMIMEYLLQSYFKHFKLYKYAFTARVLLDLKVSYEGVEDTPQPSQTQMIQEDPSEDLSKAQNSADDEDNLIDSNVDQEEKGPEMEEEAVQQLTEGQEQLQHMIAQTLSDHMKKLKLTVEKELAESNSRLSGKLEALENEFMIAPKGKKGKN